MCVCVCVCVCVCLCVCLTVYFASVLVLSDKSVIFHWMEERKARRKSSLLCLCSVPRIYAHIICERFKHCIILKLIIKL